MIKLIPKEILRIYKKFQSSGFDVYFVGGCVRNLFLRKKVKDWDITTSATPEKILELFPDAFYDNKFGTVGIPISYSSNQDITIAHPHVVEATTFRTHPPTK